MQAYANKFKELIMEEELEKQESVSIQTETVTSVETDTQKTLETLPRLEDLMKSEKEVKAKAEIQGVTQVEQKTQTQDRVFTKKSDEKKVHLKKRVKILTAVYTTVVVLLLAFVITNIATLAVLNKKINTNTDTIQSTQQQVLVEQAKPEAGTEIGNYQISLNEPRDYSEDKQELTFLDKLTILFRNLFG